MKQLIVAALLLFMMTACSQEEPAAPAAEESAAVEAPAPEATEADAATETTDEAAEEALEVVEESAAEPEPANEDEAIVLAVADTPPPPVEWKFKEGEHFARMVPTQPTVGGADKIEVVEAFMYSCPHCFDMEPYINRWAENKSPAVRFVRIPAMWNALARMHAQLYYTQEILGRNGTLADPKAFHDAVFQEFHRRGNRLTSMDAIEKLFARFDVSAEDVNKTWNSFEVNQKMRVAGDLMRRYNITGVPAIVVNGKYRTSAGDAGGYNELIELIDELTMREGLR